MGNLQTVILSVVTPKPSLTLLRDQHPLLDYQSEINNATSASLTANKGAASIFQGPYGPDLKNLVILAPNAAPITSKSLLTRLQRGFRSRPVTLTLTTQTFMDPSPHAHLPFCRSLTVPG